MIPHEALPVLNRFLLCLSQPSICYNPELLIALSRSQIKTYDQVKYCDIYVFACLIVCIQIEKWHWVEPVGMVRRRVYICDIFIGHTQKQNLQKTGLFRSHIYLMQLFYPIYTPVDSLYDVNGPNSWTATPIIKTVSQEPVFLDLPLKYCHTGYVSATCRLIG